ncbi:MAG: hypothetical protein ACQEQL_07555 [Pseudomonadota bacterium]
MPHGLAIYDAIALLKQSNERAPARQLVPLAQWADEDLPDVFDDIYSLNAQDLTLFDLNAEDAEKRLLDILALTPVYRMTLELLIDEALCIRLSAGENDPVTRAIEYAFKGLPFPDEGIDPSCDDLQAGLVHTALEHVKDADLTGIYIRFLRKLEAPQLYPTLFFNELIKLDRQKFFEEYDGLKRDDHYWVRFDLFLEQATPYCDRQLTAKSPEVLKKRARNTYQPTIESQAALVTDFLKLERQQLLRGEGLLWIHETLDPVKINWLDHELAKLMILEYQKTECAAALDMLDTPHSTALDSSIRAAVESYQKGVKSDFARAVFDNKPQRFWPVLKDFLDQVKARQRYAEKLS